MRRHIYKKNIYTTLLIRLLIALIIFSLSRSLFYFFNFQYFRDLDGAGLFHAFIAGIRFDITAVIVLNAPYILMNVVPLPIRSHKMWQKAANVIYVLVNITGLGLNTIDTVYFRFTSKRMTADIFSFIQTGEEDFIGLLPRFIADFYLEIIGWAALIGFFIWLSSRLKLKRERIDSILRFYLLNIFYFLLAGAIAIIGIRGGFQLRPITIIDAGKYTAAKNVSLVLNTPFSIIKSYGHTGLKEKAYFPDENVLNEIYSPVYHAPDIDSIHSFTPYNVVIIIMESFSTEYIGSLNRNEDGTSYTPYLDSIINNGSAFRAYANGKQSMEALPAIVAGLPSLTTRPYITSAYGSNHINSLASLLGEHGYTSAFYHGGRNGTMGFESFVDIAGFDHYYGKDEYGNDNDFDGNWGIYDEEYFNYFKQSLDETPQPFMVSIFSLSSHHPYSVPEKHKGKFNKGTLDIHESIMYADYALGGFFSNAAQTDWYSNTLFVITADHTSISYEEKYQSREGIYAIPLVFYMPGKIPVRVNTGIAQQTDIMPSVLAHLNYPGAYIAFGNNLFDTTANRYSVNFLNDSYQLLKDGQSLLFDGEKTTAIYPLQLNGETPLALTPSDEEVNKLELFLKAYIQQYNHRLINNQLVIRSQDE
jgi:phosphoglycerol transferase MdoB-like AlkP superfamily enzyme